MQLLKPTSVSQWSESILDISYLAKKIDSSTCNAVNKFSFKYSLDGAKMSNCNLRLYSKISLGLARNISDKNIHDFNGKKKKVWLQNPQQLASEERAGPLKVADWKLECLGVGTSVNTFSAEKNPKRWWAW